MGDRPAAADAGNVRDRLRAALVPAMRARDKVAAAALRSALAAIDNAETVDGGPLTGAGTAAATHPRLAGTVSGLGAAEVARRSLSAAQMEDVVRTEVAERLTAASDYERLGRPEQAGRLRSEAAVLEACLDSAQPDD